MDKNEKHAIVTQQKFDFYLLALVFTVLGLSVQTSRFSSGVQAFCEIAAWGALLISGLAGLSRMEWIPVSFAFHSDQFREQALVRQAKQGRPFMDQSGRALSSTEIEEHMRKAQEDMSQRAKAMTRIEQRHAVKYLVHRGLFVAGLGLLIISRAICLLSPATNVSK
jgi:hypothetical protein